MYNTSLRWIVWRAAFAALGTLALTVSMHVASASRGAATKAAVTAHTAMAYGSAAELSLHADF